MHRRVLFASCEMEVVVLFVVGDVHNNLDARDTLDLLTDVLIVDIIVLNMILVDTRVILVDTRDVIP